MDWNLEKPVLKVDGAAPRKQVEAPQATVPTGYTTPELEQTPQQREAYAAQMNMRIAQTGLFLQQVRELQVRLFLASERGEIAEAAKRDLYEGLLLAARMLGGQ